MGHSHPVIDALIDPRVHDPVAIRRAPAAVLQLALLEARSRTIAWLRAFDDWRPHEGAAAFDPPWWLAGALAWRQEQALLRMLSRGEAVPALAGNSPFGSVDPSIADAFATPRTRPERWRLPPPGREALARYLEGTLETTLDLLVGVDDVTGHGDDAADDRTLEPWRAALWREDRVGEMLACVAHALDQPAAQGFVPPETVADRVPALSVAGRRFPLGSPPGGFVPTAERWTHAAQVPDFEIDAQPVRWASFLEFLHDGGYDESRWWSEAGWAWVEAKGRRAPRDVEQAVAREGAPLVARRHGVLRQVPGGAPVAHVTVHEAEAWCRWAGRRLPTEAEWELAALQGRGSGWRSGEVLEWVHDAARWYPDTGGEAGETEGLDNVRNDSAAGARSRAQVPALHGLRVQRSGSAWGSPRLAHPRARRFAPPEDDRSRCGFRSVAL